MNPQNITQRSISLYIHNNHFCLFWKSIAISFNRAKEELKAIFKVVDNFIRDKLVKSFVKFEWKFQQVQSP